MASTELDRLVTAGLLQPEPVIPDEYDGLIDSAAKRLADVDTPGLSLDSRFDLAYNAAHALSLAALRRAGYRAVKRFVVFQALAHTLNVPAPKWRVLADCHTTRNQIEYEGVPDLDEQRVADLIAIAGELLIRLRAVSNSDRP
jgi:hypothetical protein